MSQHQLEGCEVAEYLESHSDEAIDLLIERFGIEFPSSRSLKLGEDTLRRWSKSVLETLAEVLRGGDVPKINARVYSGDVMANVSPIIGPTTTQLETWFFVGRTLAPLVWGRFADDPMKGQEAIEALEGAVIRIAKAAIADFVDMQLVAGSLTRDWFAEKSTAPAQKKPEPVDDASPTSSRLSLTAREREIVKLVAEGKTNGEIAAQLKVAQSTVKNHLSRIFDKLNVNTRAQLTRAAIDAVLL